MTQQSSSSSSSSLAPLGLEPMADLRQEVPQRLGAVQRQLRAGAAAHLAALRLVLGAAAGAALDHLAPQLLAVRHQVRHRGLHALGQRAQLDGPPAHPQRHQDHVQRQQVLLGLGARVPAGVVLGARGALLRDLLLHELVDDGALHHGVHLGVVRPRQRRLLEPRAV
eukprot:CAMPEP_0197592432 /NCGR_PEP_ID=MMETSP1326-20131121/15090_1 /TAXON_ID=1155430 /ORGANISM="Genus nov. species nov., Strain RCC2288" /LENGTH=166 /DNA_ID=CAMNT_0043158129 /DNA_START=25 /DNA_END=523 /DNA_ORIENTATION=+